MKASKDIKTKLDQIVDYLKVGGCAKIFLFGSFAEGTDNTKSDIDIAVSGISNREFFKAVARLPLLVRHRVDLVDFDELPPKYQESIKKDGVVLYAS